MSTKVLAPLILAGVLVAACPAAPVPKLKAPKTLAILYAPDHDGPAAERIAKWRLIDADGTNPRPFVKPDGKREVVALLPGQKPVVIEQVSGESITLLHPDGGDLRVSLTDDPFPDLWRAWRWNAARDAVERAVLPDAKDSDREEAVEAVVRAVGPLTPDEARYYGECLQIESVSPDGNRLAFSGDDGFTTSILDIPGKKVTDLVRVVRKPRGSSAWSFRLSPDWNWLEYRTSYDKTVASRSGIYVARIDGTRQTRIGDDGIGGCPRMDSSFTPIENSLPKADVAILSPDGTIAVLEREPRIDEPSRFSIYDLRTKREVPLPVGFGGKGCDNFRWVSVPADRD